MIQFAGKTAFLTPDQGPFLHYAGIDLNYEPRLLVQREPAIYRAGRILLEMVVRIVNRTVDAFQTAAGLDFEVECAGCG